MLGILKKLMGDPNERELKKLQPIVDKINSLEPQFKALSDDQLRGKTQEYKDRLAKGETLDDLLPEAFATVREAAIRAIGQRAFDTQVLGGIVLHQGRISEMRTGEGKTLTAALPSYLNALSGKGVHVITVNDYLARTQGEWMGQIYRFLGMEVGLILHGLDFGQRQRAYAADITYGTNNEFGFDYLRDNMVVYREQMVQRPLSYAIVDEVDSILIDEARTPLIISGQAEQSTDLYYRFAKIVPRLRQGEDYTVDEKAHTVSPSEGAVTKVERMLGVENLVGHENSGLYHHFMQALKAEALMKAERDYVVKDGEVIIVDEFTGRLMFGRRYSEGLHQAIEAKEGLKVERESQTLATITFQNYFRMYKKLAGMTGTALTEEDEFRAIYGLDVVVIPTNKPMIRMDMPDVVYKNEQAKFRAVVEEIISRHQTGQPLLVGTISIEKSEYLSRMLEKRGIGHQVLNAKHHEKEAQIIALAGQRDAVTIATNMAGRGTDIILGEGVPELGGLHIIGTERHEARRIDNQLRGRSGRQGDPGSSQFFISLEDDLMRLFGSDNIMVMMDKLKIEEDMPIEHSLLSKAIETAQKRVEARNFDIRKHVLEYDNVMNQQREVIYKQRRDILEGDNLRPTVVNMIRTMVDNALEIYCSEKVFPEEWDLEGFFNHVAEVIPLPADFTFEKIQNLGRDELKEEFHRVVEQAYERREQELGEQIMRELERVITLRMVDTKWMDHIDAMDELRAGIGLRAYGQKDPLVEYKFEAYDMFTAMTNSIQEDIARTILRVQVEQPPEREAVMVATDTAGPTQPVTGPANKVGRNDPCPCGSGKKYKHCCGK